jgi:hypothetical protein
MPAQAIRLASLNDNFLLKDFPALAGRLAADGRVIRSNPAQPTPQASDGLLANSGASVPSNITDASSVKMAQLVLPGTGIPLPLIPAVPSPSIPMPAIPDWLKTIAPILRRGLSHQGFGGNDNYRRCMRAVDGDTDDWESFCKSLDRAQNNTSGGESQNRACWSRTFESKNNKEGWCKNQFGGL